MKTTHPVIIGIDIHKATHVAVAIDTQGTRSAALSISENPKGYLELARWSRSLGNVLAFGVEGTGSYGAIQAGKVTLILVGDDPTRIRSEAAFANLCGVCPIPASSGKTHRFRLNRGGNRQANAALYRVAIVRMRSHEPTRTYAQKRTKDGKSKSEIIRCLKRAPGAAQKRGGAEGLSDQSCATQKDSQLVRKKASTAAIPIENVSRSIGPQRSLNSGAFVADIRP